MPRTITDVPASGTRRYRMGQYGSGTVAFPGFTKCAWPTAGKFLNLVFWVEDAPGEGNAFTLTMVLDGVETALTCTISGTDTTARDVAHSVGVGAAQSDRFGRLDDAHDATCPAVSALPRPLQRNSQMLSNGDDVIGRQLE